MLETSSKEFDFGNLLNDLPTQIEKLGEIRKLVLTDAVLLGEIPAPTFNESDRIRLTVDRFRENGLEDPEIDEHGNASAVLPGSEGGSSILVMAHADSVFDANTQHVLNVGPDSITGPGIADNAIGLATVVALPKLLKMLDITLKDDLILLANTKSLGKGNLEGARYFLETKQRPIRSGICVEGATQGRLSYSGLGTLRGEIRLEVPSNYDWNRFGSSGAVGHLTRMVNQLLEIPLPKEPKTKMVLGGLTCGTTYNKTPRRGVLRFEITSEADEVLDELKQKVDDLCQQCALENGTLVNLEIVARRPNCSIPFTHPLVKATRSIMNEIGITPQVIPSTGDLNVLIEAGYSGVTLGLTEAENLGEINETIFLDPLQAGIAQLLTLLQAIDQGLCES
jgi:acetylornithine deacetylase/succinyl-diaminopimelate desuccinylase-like protein